MKHQSSLSVLLAVAGAAFLAGRVSLAPESALAQAEPSRSNQPSTLPDGEARMQAMMNAGAPGRFHAALEPSIGEFEAVVRFAMEPGAPLIESKGVVKREWVHDGRFVKETVEAETMGSPYRATGYIGYNNVDGQYEIVWMDNQSTGIMFETGSMNLDTNVMTMLGSRRDPATGRVIRNVGRWDLSDPDRQTASGHTLDAEGREFKSFEGVFERVKH
jgi:hypothetical protein